MQDCFAEAFLEKPAMRGGRRCKRSQGSVNLSGKRTESYPCAVCFAAPPAKRLEMTEQFNAGQGQIFLISLKAGGTGLNLTGADTVIHYDPWWNPAAEDQATDRAHRIGQTRKVEVIRLVTHGSIEEQVVELGQRKKALFDQLITPGEELVTALTEQDIRALFT